MYSKTVVLLQTMYCCCRCRFRGRLVGQMHLLLPALRATFESIVPHATSRVCDSRSSMPQQNVNIISAVWVYKYKYM